MTRNFSNRIKKSLSLCLLALSLFLLGCEKRQANEEIEPVSLFQLIVQPNEYHGMLIGTVGVLRLDFEGTALHVSSEDADLGISVNSIWLEMDPAGVEKYRDLAGEHVIVHGIFDATGNGHLGMYRGSIVEIESIWPIPGRSDTGGVDHPNSSD